MRKLFLALLLLCSAGSAQALCLPATSFNGIEWVECTVIGIPPSPITIPAVFANSYTGIGTPAGNWEIVDLKLLGVPADAAAVQLAGLLILTPGTGNQDSGRTVEMTLRFRRPGDDPPWKYVSWPSYIGQVVDRNGVPGQANSIGEGTRSTMGGNVIPLRDGKFEWGWDRSTYGGHPDSAAYGINLNVQLYFR